MRDKCKSTGTIAKITHDVRNWALPSLSLETGQHHKQLAIIYNWLVLEHHFQVLKSLVSPSK